MIHTFEILISLQVITPLLLWKEVKNITPQKESLANVIHDVNSLVKDGEMTIDRQTIGLEFFLGGHYKVSYLGNL